MESNKLKGNKMFNAPDKIHTQLQKKIILKMHYRI